MAGDEWKSILGALEELPLGLPTEHVAAMARWFLRQLAGTATYERQPKEPNGSSEEANLDILSFVEVRRRMEQLGSSRELRAQEKALLCAWVWSLSGEDDFCSNDAQKLYGEEGRNLNAHHFNAQASEANGSKEPSPSSLIRVGKGRYRFTERGRDEGARLARTHLFRTCESAG
jgi:hypothetical protein